MARMTDIDEILEKVIKLQASGGRTEKKVGEIILAITNAPTVEVVQCKDCELWLPEELERCKAMKSKPYGLCNRYPQRTDWQDTTYEDDFCSYGERKDNG